MADLNTPAVRRVLGDPNTHGLVLLTILLHTFGSSVFGDDELEIERMDPAEMWAGINNAYGTWIPEEGENKVNALMLAMDSALFYRDPEVFQAVCCALLDGDIGDMIESTFDEPSVVEMLWAILEVELANDFEEGPPEFSGIVQAYIDRLKAEESEDLDAALAAVQEEFYDLMRTLKEIGVPDRALRLFDQEYVETMQAVGA